MICRAAGCLLLGQLLLLGCGESWDLGFWRQSLQAYCSVTVEGRGVKEVETDYLPHVVACENGAAEPEALKAQAVAARTFLYYKIDSSGAIGDGTGDQVYTCVNQPEVRHYEAVAATSGQVLQHSRVVICGFFVAGARPSSPSCVAQAGDPDSSPPTEKYVTYNEGRSGAEVLQTSLGWIDPGNLYNRGCKSQNGAHCLAQQGRRYPEILRFYYGADIELQSAQGACVTPQPIPDGGSHAVPDAPPAGQEGGLGPEGGSVFDGGWIPVEPSGRSLQPTLRGGCTLAANAPAVSSWGWLLLALLACWPRRANKRIIS